ncbi:TetR family transcriptional regulator [Rhodococcus aerolatus]
MTGTERRHQLLTVGRAVFAEKGFDGATIEEVAARAGVSKPVVYEHFGGKEGLYAVVVDRERTDLLDRMTEALSTGHARERLEKAARAILTYVEESADGFRILVRGSPAHATGSFSSLLNDVTSRVEHILGDALVSRGHARSGSAIHAQALVGMVSLTAQWWLDEREPSKDVVVAHLVNLSWNGLANLEADDDAP